MISLASSAFRAIIGEYSKKIWFNYIEPQLRRPAAAILKKLGLLKEPPKSDETISAAELELQQLRAMVERLLIERDAMQLELIRRRVLDNSKDEDAA